MQPVRWERRPDALRAPALVCAFKGWNDAGESASSALSFLGSGLGADRFAVIDPEEFVDFQATRPTVRLADGRQRVIDWPDIEVYEAGVPRASLWAAVPHYVAVVPNPKGSLAILRRLESLIGITVDAAELEDAAGEYERQVSRAVEMDPEVQAFVEKLERTADEEESSPDPSSLPSGDLLAREFQRFLRQRGNPPG